MRILLIAAIVLIAFAIIATASATGTCLSVGWATWLSASVLAYFADVLFGWTFSPAR